MERDPVVLVLKLGLVAFGAWYVADMVRRRGSRGNARPLRSGRRVSGRIDDGRSTPETDERIARLEQLQLRAVGAFAIGLIFVFLAVIALPLWAAWTVIAIAVGVPLVVYVVAEIFKTWFYVKSLDE